MPRAAFTLPEGNVQIAFSGGRTSAYLLHQILEANGGLRDGVEVTFQNTGRERPETLDFVAEVGRRWGVSIRWLERAPRRKMRAYEFRAVRQAFGGDYARGFARWWVSQDYGPGFNHVSHNSAARAGEPFVALILERRFLPNQQSRFCTTELKIRTAKRYLVSLGWKRWTNAVGLRADETARLVGLPRSWKPAGEWVMVEGKRVWQGEPRPKDRWVVWTPLADAGVSRHDVAAFWAAQPFDLRLPNVGGKCWLGNCDGCFLKSEANLAAFARDFPEDHVWWERAEALATLLSRAKSETPGRGAWWSKRYTRRELRQFMERQDDLETLTELGVLCQADGGECTT